MYRVKIPLSVSHPEIAELAHGWNPDQYSRGSKVILEWKCPKGHIWKNSPKGLTQGAGCRVCSGREVQIGINDLKSLFPEIAAEAEGWNPESITRGSPAVKNWKCSKCGHIWKARVQSRTKLKSGCPICNKSNGREASANSKFRDPNLYHPKRALSADFPNLIERLKDPKNLELTSGSRKKIEWICTNSHLFEMRVQDFVKKYSDNNDYCPICLGLKIYTGVNDLKTLYPNIAREAHGWDPSKKGVGSHGYVDWKCPKGHIYSAQISDRTRKTRNAKGAECPFCNNKSVLQGFNDLSTTHPYIANQVIKGDPKSVTAGSEKKFEWICPEGHQYKKQVFARVSGRGCPTCAKTGYDGNSEGWLYLIENEEMNALQIGISNVPEQRIKYHESQGWKLLDVRGPMDGWLALKLETDILNFLKRIDARPVDPKDTGKYSGITESWIATSYPIFNLRELIDKLRDFEFKNGD